jgi:hypothetical protein
VREQVEPELEVAVNVTCSQLQVQLCELRELGRTQPLCEAFAVVTVGQSGCKPALAHQQTQHVGGERTHDAGRVSSAEPGLPQAGKRGHRAPWVRGGGLAEGPEQRPRLIRRACARQGSPRDAGHHLVGDAVKQRARGGNVAVQRYQAATQLGGQALHRDCCDAFGFDELDRGGDDAFA